MKPGGHLIFTTHGVHSVKHFGEVEFDSEGFFFRAESEQKDLDTADYGMTVSLPRFVMDAIGKTSLAPVFFQEGFWWEHQDVYIVRV